VVGLRDDLAGTVVDRDSVVEACHVLDSGMIGNYGMVVGIVI